MTARRHANDQIIASLLLVLLAASTDYAVANDTASGDTSSFSLPLLLVATTTGIGGLLCCSFGYRLFRATCFASGCLLGGIVLSGLVRHFVRTTSSHWVAAATGSFIVGGLAMGFVAQRYIKIGILVVASAFGVQAAYGLHTSLVAAWPSLAHSTMALVLLLVVTCSVSQLLALQMHRRFLIVATAFIGATTTAWALGLVIGHYPQYADFTTLLATGGDGSGSGSGSSDSTGSVAHVSAVWWAYMALSLVLTVAGAWVQFKKTARAVKHDPFDPTATVKLDIGGLQGEFVYKHPVLTPPVGPSLQTRV